MNFMFTLFDIYVMQEINSLPNVEDKNYETSFILSTLHEDMMFFIFSYFHVILKQTKVILLIISNSPKMQ